jgi:hypothetical protein
MAAVTKVELAPTAPAPYHYNDKSTKEFPLTEDVATGDELKLTSTGWRKRQAGETADGISLKPGRAGKKGHDIGIVGEMDGFSGLVPGDKLYPSATVNGGLDTSSVAGFVPRVTCVSTTRIRYNYA